MKPIIINVIKNIETAAKSGKEMAKEKTTRNVYKIKCYKFTYADNPYNELSGNFGKRLKSVWHNSFKKARGS